MSAFGEWMCSDTPSQEANLIAKAVNQVTKNGMALSQACLIFNVEDPQLFLLPVGWLGRINES